jgi:hydrogenase maturation protein HypF
MRESTGINRIAVSGGVFQNALLSELLLPALAAEGFEVYTHENVPPGDGGIAVGQVYFLPGKL